MGNKYRAPFVFDGRAATLDSSKADLADTLMVYDDSDDSTKTITMEELGASLEAVSAIAPVWRQPPELQAAVTAGNETITLAADDAGKHLLYPITSGDPLNLVFDMDAVPSGEWVLITIGLIDSATFGGGANVFNFQVGGTVAGTRPYGSAEDPTAYDVPAGFTTNCGFASFAIRRNALTAMEWVGLNGNIGQAVAPP